MTLCPIAIVAGCKNCPVVSICPLKGIIGDYRKPEEPQAGQQGKSTQDQPKRAK